MKVLESVNQIILTVNEEEIHVDKETREIEFVIRNKRKYKSARYIKNYYYTSIVNEYFASLETEESNEIENSKVSEEIEIKISNGIKDNKAVVNFAKNYNHMDMKLDTLYDIKINDIHYRIMKIIIEGKTLLKVIS